MRQLRHAIHSFILLFCLGLLLSPNASGQWRHLGANDQLTGHTEATGRIQQPEVLWKYPVGSREALITAQPGATEENSLAIATADVSTSGSFEQQWGLNGPWLDLDGDGVLKQGGQGIGRILATVPGMQQLIVMDGYQNETSPTVQLMVRENKQWKEYWKRPQSPTEDWTEYMLGAPIPIAGDFDGDNKAEIAFQGWYWIYVLDAETGKMKAKARFIEDGKAESGRGYGWWGAHDFNGDGKSEFVMIGDTQNQITVMGWDQAGTFKRLWHQLINYDAFERISTVRPGTDPLHDINGDGRAEIVFSIFNYDPATGDTKNDQQWHVWALDGMTGKTVLDLRNQVLAGMQDIDGDGAAEIFTTEAPTEMIPQAGRLTVWRFKGGQLEKCWSQENESFQTVKVNSLPLTANTSACGEHVALLAQPLSPNGLPVFFTQRMLNLEDRQTRVTAWQWNGKDKIKPIGNVEGPNAEALAVRTVAEGHSILFRVQMPAEPTQVKADGLKATLAASKPMTLPVSPVCIGRLAKDSAPTVVVQGGSELLYAFNPYSKPDRQLLWRRPGRGMYTGGSHAIGQADVGGVLLADLLGQGNLAAVAATQAESGCARLVAYDAQGQALWQHDFSDIPGKTPSHNTSGLTHWFCGRFTSADRYDIFATPRPKSQEEGNLLSGSDGKLIWQRKKVPSDNFPTRPVGGSWMACLDFDGDHLDDIASNYPDRYYVLQGSTGDILVNLSSPELFPDAAIRPYNGIPIIADFLGNGGQQLLWSACDRAFGVHDKNGKVIWHETRPIPCGPGIPSGVGDVNGDNKLDILAIGQNDEGKCVAYCYEGATGKVQWKLPLPCDVFVSGLYPTEQTPTPPAMADIDSNGRDECVFTYGRTICAIGQADGQAQGTILWQLELPESVKLGPVSIADVRGSGEAEIVVSARNGQIYGIGQRDK